MTDCNVIGEVVGEAVHDFLDILDHPDIRLVLSRLGDAVIACVWNCQAAVVCSHQRSGRIPKKGDAGCVLTYYYSPFAVCGGVTSSRSVPEQPE